MRVHVRATYAIAGGYSAGHITPGLALADHLRGRPEGLEVVFFGASGGIEAELVPRAGLPFIGLPAAPWARHGTATRTRALASLVPAVLAARSHLKRVRATGLAAFGSFAAVGPGLAARSLGLPVLVYEPNAAPGLATRVLLPGARRLLTSSLFDPASLKRPVERTTIGVPLGRAWRDQRARVPQPGTERPSLLVLGGSLGDEFLNRRMPVVAGLIARGARGEAGGTPLRVVHQCGRSLDTAAIHALYRAAGVTAEVHAFIDELAPAVAEAHFVVTAAGAITLHEVAAVGVPVLVVPLHAGAAAHQYANADAFARGTGCLQRTEAAWNDERVAIEIARLLNSPAEWSGQRDRLRAFAPDDAAERFATWVESTRTQKARR